MSLRVSRRELLSTGSGLGVLGTIPATAQRADGDSPTDETDTATTHDGRFEHFVETDGTAFTVDGRDTYFSGGNHPQLRIGDAWSDGLMDTFFAEWEEAAPATNCIRIPAFATGTERTMLPLMPEPGEFNESSFVVLDDVLATCAEYGMRVVFILTNYWDWNGGVPQYVEWASDADSKADFYTAETTREWYREYVQYVLERENTVTGVPYREDPTIAMWELMNEPRVAEDPAETVEWIDEMSSFVNSIDGNHLVSPGIGGGRAWDVPEWYWDVYELDTIDAWSFHVWADSNHQDIGVDGGREWIDNHTEAAHSLSMPAYCGEFGWHVDPTRSAANIDTQLTERDAVFEAWYETMDATGTNGALVWDLRAETEYTLEWNSYAVYPREESTAGVVATWSETLTNKSEREPSEPSLSDYTDSDGRIPTDNLRDAIADWRDSDIEIGLLRDVIEEWREG